VCDQTGRNLPSPHEKITNSYGKRKGNITKASVKMMGGCIGTKPMDGA
jgi:S-methylmethionine-dependent homocysteine/selenocysteine methylase